MTEIKKEYDENYALEVAVNFSTMSNCGSKRGVVIWNRKVGVLAGGWNAPPYPQKCDGSPTCRGMCAKTAVHAEQDALMAMYNPLVQKVMLENNITMADCEMLHVKSVDGKAVTSEKPSCWQCSKLILSSGLKSMWLNQEQGLVEYSAARFHCETLVNCELF